jgi:hypothetical protein
MSDHKLWIPGPLPGLADIIDAAKGVAEHGYSYTSLRKLWVETVAARAREAHTPHVERALFRFRWVEKNRRRNPDNITAVRTFLFSGLVLAKVLEGAGWGQIVGWTDSFEIDSHQGVEIVIETRHTLIEVPVYT